MRDGIRLAADLYSASPEPETTPLPVLLERTPYGRPRAARFGPGPQRRARPAARGHRPALHRSPLPRRTAGLPGPGRLRGHVREVPRRGPGRRGHDRLAPEAAVVRRQGRDDGGVLLSPRPGSSGRRRGDRAGRHVPGLWRFLLRVRRGDADGRRLRAEAGDLGTAACRAQPGGGGGSGAGRATAAGGRDGLVRRDAVAPRLHAAAAPVGVRGLPAGAVAPGHLRGLLPQPGDLRTRLLRPLPGRAEPAHGQLVRPLRPLHHRELHRPAGAEVGTFLPGHGPLDARTPLRDVRRRRGLRSTGDPGRQPRPVVPGVPPPLVRPGAGPGERLRPPGGPVLPDGRR